MILVLIWLLNFGISAWNAYAVGSAWVETRVVGGWRRLLCWSGAVMSATGFTWCYLILFVLGGHQFHYASGEPYVTEEQVNVALSLGYILLVPGLLLSGLVITVDSWARAFRNGGFMNYGIAAYNTYAQIHNTWSAISTLPAAFSQVRSYFGKNLSDRDDRNKSGLIIVILLVGLALAAGVLTTTLIIWMTAGSRPLPPPPSGYDDRASNIDRRWRS